MERWIAMLLAAPMLFSCAMAETGGLDLNREVKPATAFTAKANAAVYDELDFEDKQEYEFAVRGLIDAPETESGCLRVSERLRESARQRESQPVGEHDK